MSGLDEVFTPEELAELAEWDADAYRICVEVPTSKITEAQLDALHDRISATVDDWATGTVGCDWDPFIYGHGPMHRKAEG